MKKIVFIAVLLILTIFLSVADTESFPSSDYQLWNFEDNFENQSSNDNWFIYREPDFSTDIKKFGSYSLTSYIGDDSGGDRAGIHYFNMGDPNQSQNFGLWFYGNITNGESTGEHQYALIQIKTPAGASVYCYMRVFIKKENLSNNMRVILELRKDEDESEITLTDTEIIAPEIWHYIAMSYNADTDQVSLIVNDRIITSEVLGGTWYSQRKFGCLVSLLNTYTIPGYNNTRWIYIDEAITFPNQNITPQVFVDHYNHNVP